MKTLEYFFGGGGIITTVVLNFVEFFEKCQVFIGVIVGLMTGIWLYFKISNEIKKRKQLNGKIK